jgi:hypothetical protein
VRHHGEEKEEEENLTRLFRGSLCILGARHFPWIKELGDAASPPMRDAHVYISAVH